MRDALDDVEPAADKESTGVVIITGSEVSMSYLVMRVAFSAERKF